MSERELVLGRIRKALAASHPAEDSPSQGDFLRTWDAPREEIVALFVEHAADYRADVRRVEADSAALAITARLRERGVDGYFVNGIPAGFKWFGGQLRLEIRPAGDLGEHQARVLSRIAALDEIPANRKGPQWDPYEGFREMMAR